MLKSEKNYDGEYKPRRRLKPNVTFSNSIYKHQAKNLRLLVNRALPTEIDIFHSFKTTNVYNYNLHQLHTIYSTWLQDFFFLFFDLLTTILPSSRESYDSLETLIGDNEEVECIEHVDILHMFTERTTKRSITMLIGRRTYFFHRTINIRFINVRHKKEQRENVI
uniref:Uncharacterized protein n=1 Tax=Glossina palpalis gambiensis TaxID=67801 RepID=A0A1B0BF48_9MUSC